MISSRDLTDEQVASIRNWAGDGAQLPDIQKRLLEEFGMNATYMDTRFLVLDLGIELVSEESEEPEEAAEPTGSEAPVEDAAMPEDAGAALEEEPAPSPLDPNAPASAGTVAVNVDELTRPGAMVSGSVVFSDGEKALWMIDEMGRLGLDPTTPGYQPSEPDIGVFQEELRRKLGG